MCNAVKFKVLICLDEKKTSQPKRLYKTGPVARLGAVLLALGVILVYLGSFFGLIRVLRTIGVDGASLAEPSPFDFIHFDDGGYFYLI